MIKDQYVSASGNSAQDGAKKREAEKRQAEKAAPKKSPAVDARVTKPARGYSKK